MKRITLLGLAAGVSMIAAGAFGQGQDFSKVQIKSTPLGNDTYMLEGQGGNIIVAVGGDGVIQVDGEFAPLHDKIKAEVDRISHQHAFPWRPHGRQRPLPPGRNDHRGAPESGAQA